MPRTASARRSHFNLSFRPKSYWPPRARGVEVEIARISVSSSSRDVISLKARRAADRRIQYRMIHEDVNGRTAHRIRVRPASSTQPLTLGELIAMLEAACYSGPCPDEGDDVRFGGVIWGTLRLNLEHGIPHADDYVFFMKVTSRHYRQLARYYDERLSEWCLENCNEEDCGTVVRFRTGRFARKLLNLA